MGCGILYRMVAEQIGLRATLATCRTAVGSVLLVLGQQRLGPTLGDAWLLTEGLVTQAGCCRCMHMSSGELTRKQDGCLSQLFSASHI